MREFAFLCTLLTITVTVTLCHDDDVHTVQYNTETFAEEVPKKNHFVMFYAPWCGHCQRFGPTWEQLAEMLNEEDGSVRIAKVDCTVDNKVCSEQDVTGYPTLKFFKVGESEAVKFRGTRDLPTLTAFINDQLGSDFDEHIAKLAKPDALIELTEDNFENTVTQGKHFVKFYAPWCGHCQKLAPVWEQLAETMKGDTSINVAKIDCTQYRTICNQFEVKGYPTLLWIEDGKKVGKYQGDRSQEDLKKYVKTMSGSIAKDADSDSLNKSDEEQVEDVPSAVLMLTADDFEETVQKGVSIVKFFAPWCGHCKRLASTWEDLGKMFSDNENVHVVKVDCTLEPNRALCSQQEVDGYPSVFLYKNGDKLSEYNGDRSLDDLFNFVQSHISSHDEL